jgi:DNA (cytosine-5)-methyltransferase 1
VNGVARFPSSDEGLRELALFAGAGGGILGGHLLGWRTVCAVEWEPYAASVLAARQNDGLLPPFPIWDDVRTFDGQPWRGLVDVVSGGFPCQDISVAGKGDGLDGERSGLWSEMARIIGEVRPRYAFVENSPALTTRGLGRVVGDLASLGYDCRWGVVSAADSGAPHERERIWMLAYTNNSGPRFGCAEPSWRTEPWRSREKLADAYGAQLEGGGAPIRAWQEYGNTHCASGWWDSDPADDPESGVGRMAPRMAQSLDRLKAIGNGQVPQAAALAWRTLTEGI